MRSKQNVVHRDIKPANIMYEPGSDTVKITDFGIARITDSSKTKTGMVLIKDADQRYQTGIEFANALNNFLKT